MVNEKPPGMPVVLLVLKELNGLAPAEDDEADDVQPEPRVDVPLLPPPPPRENPENPPAPDCGGGGGAPVPPRSYILRFSGSLSVSYAAEIVLNLHQTQKKTEKKEKKNNHQ